MAAKKKNKKLRLALKIFFTVFLTAAIIIAGVAVGVLFGMIDTTDSVSLDALKLDFTSVIYYEDENGNPVEYETLYSDENRVWVDYAEIPACVKNAAVAIEDERFYSHIGFDVKSTAYATFNYIFKKSSDRGASTITQQLVKNLTGEKDKNAGRKIKEIITAVGIERKMSKEQILELYLNTIYLGHRCNGIGSAAEYYFDKDVSKLTPAEAAAIIGITQYPTKYDPIINPEDNKEKQETVLFKMHQLGYLTDDEYQKAKEQPLEFKGKTREKTSIQSYFADEVISEVIHDLQTECGYTEAVATKMLYTGGLKIYCTIDPEIQQIMEKVYKDDTVIPKAPYETQPQSSMTVMDPKTGYIKGIVGGRGEKTADRVLNRASQTTRQPGSSIKPIAVYGPAINEGVTSPGSVWEDKKVTFGTWSPKNYTGRFSGPVTVRYALSQSLNTVAVQVLDKLGTSTSYDYLKNRLGITTLTDSDRNLAALALGGLTKGVTNVELTAAYCSFANKGVYIQPTTYTKILSHSDDIIYEKKQEKNKAFSEETAGIMLNLLKSVVSNGTGSSARFSGGYDIAGKTGTTDKDMDRWFVGMTPYYAGAVWVGYDTSKPLSFFPYNPTTKLWKTVMSEIHTAKKLAPKTFGTVSGNYKYVTVCADSGLLPGENCAHDVRGSRLRSEYFLPGSVPTKTCTFKHDTGGLKEDENTPEHSDVPKTEEPKTETPAHTTPPSGGEHTETPKPPATDNPDILSENGL